MPNNIGVYDTEGEFPGWGEMAVIRGEMRVLRRFVGFQTQVHQSYEEQLREIIFGLRYRHSPFDEPDGVTWAEIGELLGISRQAAQQRFGLWVDQRRDELIDEYVSSQQQGEDGE